MVESSTDKALGKMILLPQNLILVDDVKFSTVLGADNTNADTENVPGVGASVPYRAVPFLASGSTGLDPQGADGGADEWFVSIKPENQPAQTDRPADNFATIHIDPVTGRTRIYRP